MQWLCVEASCNLASHVHNCRTGVTEHAAGGPGGRSIKHVADFSYAHSATTFTVALREMARAYIYAVSPSLADDHI